MQKKTESAKVKLKKKVLKPSSILEYSHIKACCTKLYKYFLFDENSL